VKKCAIATSFDGLGGGQAQSHIAQVAAPEAGRVGRGGAGKADRHTGTGQTRVQLRAAQVEADFDDFVLEGHDGRVDEPAVAPTVRVKHPKRTGVQGRDAFQGPLFNMVHDLVIGQAHAIVAAAVAAEPIEHCRHLGAVVALIFVAADVHLEPLDVHGVADRAQCRL
jgi:hypothetical protein